MTIRQYLILMSAGTLGAGAALAFLLITLNPETAGSAGFALLYGSFFLACLGAFTLAGLFLRRLIHRNVVLARQVRTSFRQGTFFGVLVTGSLLLQGHGLLTWWNALLFALATSTVEFFFLSLSGDR
jgi:hypothetical protein